MTPRNKPILVAAAVIVVLWGAVIGLRSLARTQAVTAASVTAWLADHPLPSDDSAARRAHLEQLAEKINRLPGRDRLDRALGESIRAEFMQMTDAERQDHLDRTLPRGFDELMNALNAMDPEKRRDFVREAERRMARETGAPPEEFNDQQVQQIVDQGMKSYLASANAQTKLDLQPLITQMQANLQRRR